MQLNILYSIPMQYFMVPTAVIDYTVWSMRHNGLGDADDDPRVELSQPPRCRQPRVGDKATIGDRVVVCSTYRIWQPTHERNCKIRTLEKETWERLIIVRPTHETGLQMSKCRP